ncbi:MAG: type II toxin-antitoxin system RelE/ParE family toxin [Methylocystis sp.]
MILVCEDAALDFERLRNFLEIKSPRAASHAAAAIWTAIQALDEFPHLGAPRGKAGVRQLIVRHGSSAYVVRYAILVENEDILVLRVWRGREARP